MAYTKGTVLRTAFDTYRIQSKRGEGGSGEVFDVLDSAGETRALKVLRVVKDDQSGLRRSRDEFNFCFRSTHKNIIPVIDCGLTGSKAAFYVMPLYPLSLRDWIRRGIPEENVLRLFGNILDGIEAAHLHNIVHGDLKPENILTSEDGLDLVIADFGIAPLLEKHEDEYAAPEQRSGASSVDEKADVYALGILLHELFTGKTSIGLGKPDIADVAPNFAYLDWTVGRMTNPEPERRLSVTEVKRELIARGLEFLSIQRLNALKTEILREREVDDPLLRNPITIQAVDFKGETLYLTLNVPPPDDWVKAFRTSGVSAGPGIGPERFVFLGKLAHLKLARGVDPQQLLECAKVYVDAANRQYEEMAVAAHHHNLEQERQKRMEMIAAEERRHHVLSRLRL
jgi:serine/threonine protein kinase